jgi:hypothetical protein
MRGGNREIRELINQVLGVYLIDPNIMLTKVLRVQLGNELKKVALALFALLKKLFEQLQLNAMGLQLNLMGINCGSDRTHLRSCQNLLTHGDQC